MKRFQKFVSVLMSAAVFASLLALFPAANALRVSADRPTTFYVKYDQDEGSWRMQISNGEEGVEWRDEDPGRELYYLNNGDERAKNGDIVVILPTTEVNDAGETITVNAPSDATIEVSARLGNLTVNRVRCVVHAGGIDSCYVLGNSYAAINGDVTNAYVYDNAICNFNNNVGNLRLISSEENTVNTDVYVKGTVGYASLANPGGVLNEYYNFKADCFYFSPSGGLLTDPANYSTSGSGPVSSAAPAAAPSKPASNSGAYDDVPKTGESNKLAIWLFAISAICLTGHLALRKSL